MAPEPGLDGSFAKPGEFPLGEFKLSYNDGMLYRWSHNILHCFRGIRQPGHAAMTRFTSSKGWLICLGAFVWEVSTWDDLRSGAKNHAQRHGNDFLEEANARMTDSYENVVILECLADCFGETVQYGYDQDQFWRSLSISERKKLAQSSPEGNNKTSENAAMALYRGCAALGQQYETETIVVEDDGTIVVPAASYNEKSKFKKNVASMDSFLGGKQMHFDKDDGEAEYLLPADIAGGTYELSLKIVNVHRDQKPMTVVLDHASSDEAFDGFELLPSPSQTMDIPYTAGSWQRTQDPIEVELSPGGKLQLSRKAPCWGLTVKEIVLKPKQSS